jgi:hypothetical protein
MSAVFLFCCLNCFGQFISPVEWWDSYEGKSLDLGKLKGKFGSIEIKGYTATDYFGELKLHAFEKLLAEEKLRDGELVFADDEGKPVIVRAREFEAYQQKRAAEKEKKKS